MRVKMSEIRIKDEFIKLGQAMKLSGLALSGVEAKIFIENGEVSVNGEVCTQRGKKLRVGDRFSFGDEEITVTQ